MQELSSQRALPHRLEAALQRAGLSGHVLQWARHRDGRSNHALADVYLLALDCEPGLFVLKIAGEDAHSIAAVEHERATLEHLAGQGVLAPALHALSGRLPGELASSYIPGGPLEQLIGSSWDPAPLATDLALALSALWAVPPTDPHLQHPGERGRQLLGDVLDPAIADQLASWELGAAARWRSSEPHLLHGDLRPSNIRITLDGGGARLTGFVDFAMSSVGPIEEDFARFERTATEAHPMLATMLREALPPLDPALLRDASIRITATLLQDTTRNRDWARFRQLAAELDRLLQ